MCGREVGLLNERIIQFNKFSVCLCEDCAHKSKLITSGNSARKEKAISFFQDQLTQNTASPIGDLYIKYLFGEDITDESIPEEAKAEANRREVANANKREFSALTIWGAVFACLAVVLYILSIREVKDGYSSIYVANLQTTIFAATSAIASVMCFIGQAIVNAIKEKA